MEIVSSPVQRAMSTRAMGKKSSQVTTTTAITLPLHYY